MYAVNRLRLHTSSRQTSSSRARLWITTTIMLQPNSAFSHCHSWGSRNTKSGGELRDQMFSQGLGDWQARAIWDQIANAAVPVAISNALID